MENQSTDRKESSSLPRVWVERLIYILITLVLYIIPFLAPGITEVQRIEVFFGGTIIVILAFMIYGVFDSIKMSRHLRSRPKRRSH